jgi:long-chain-fatty-acid--CoA ligase ACSBG
MAGCISSGIYTTNNSEVCLDISKRCQVEVLVLENNIQLSKYVDRLSELTHLKAIVIYDDSFDSHLVEKCLLQNIRVYDFHSFLQLGHTITDDEYYTRQNGILPGQCSSLIFTSGTTGPPKAVMLSHDNVTWCTQVTIDNANRPAFDCNERIISYLPLSHVSAQLVRFSACFFYHSLIYTSYIHVHVLSIIYYNCFLFSGRRAYANVLWRMYLHHKLRCIKRNFITNISRN